MDLYDDFGDGSPDTAADTALADWRTDYQNLDERRRARHRRDSAGASRDLAASLLEGA